MKKVIFCLAVAALLTACANVAAVSNDFDVVCNEFEALSKLKNFARLSPQVRNEKLEESIGSKLSSESNALTAWLAISHVEGNQRYPLFVEAAKSTGLEAWRCKAMKDHAYEVGQF